MFFIAVVSSALSQDLVLECDFFDTWQYECSLNHITVLDPNQNIIIGGEHLENRTNDDVRIVQIRNSETPFMIQQIFETFRNIEELYIHNSNLQSIRIPDIVQLTQIHVDGNNISRIENGSFDGQSNLWFLNLRDNNIQEIEIEALTGLEALGTLNLVGNHIQALVPGTFDSLRNLSRVELDRNNLTSISDELFAQSPLVRILYIEANLIDQISPRLIASLVNLTHIDLTGNACIDRDFYIENDDEFNLIIMHNALRTCYNNFVGVDSNIRRVTFEFEGPLRLFDEFGNIVANL